MLTELHFMGEAFQGERHQMHITWSLLSPPEPSSQGGPEGEQDRSLF
jgi:hypothetical protein